MAEATISYDGQTYPAPSRFTIRELAEGRKLGAHLPKGVDDEPEVEWLAVMLLTAKRRAGENVDAESMLDIVIDDITFTAATSNGNGSVPPTNAGHARASNKPKRGK